MVLDLTGSGRETATNDENPDEARHLLQSRGMLDERSRQSWYVQPFVNSVLRGCYGYHLGMHDMAVFTEVATLRAKPSGRDVSLSALEMHVRVVDHTVHTDCPGFITDAGLDAVAPGPATTMAAIELSLAGFWRRIDGGYVIADDELIHELSHSTLRRKLAAVGRRMWKVLNNENFIPF